MGDLHVSKHDWTAKLKCVKFPFLSPRWSFTVGLGAAGQYITVELELSTYVAIRLFSLSNPKNHLGPRCPQVLTGCYGAAARNWTDAIDSLCSALVRFRGRRPLRCCCCYHFSRESLLAQSRHT